MYPITMTFKAHIRAIYIAPFAGAQMKAMTNVKVSRGLGIEGDRYALGTGAYSASAPSKIRHISLISLSGIETANEWLLAGNEPTFDETETRRNIVLTGILAIELNELVGRQFSLGDIHLKGTELCTPCERPAQLQNKPSFMEAFDGRGGIRAEVLRSGTLKIGDILSFENKT